MVTPDANFKCSFVILYDRQAIININYLSFSLPEQTV